MASRRLLIAQAIMAAAGAVALSDFCGEAVGFFFQYSTLSMPLVVWVAVIWIGLTWVIVWGWVLGFFDPKLDARFGFALNVYLSDVGGIVGLTCAFIAGTMGPEFQNWPNALLLVGSFPLLLGAFWPKRQLSNKEVAQRLAAEEFIRQLHRMNK